MHGSYKAERWDVAQLDILINRLRESGVATDASWRWRGRVASPRQADNLRLSHAGKVFLVQRGKLGTVMPGRLPPAQANALLNVLGERELVQPPRYGVGVLCALGYCLLYLLALLPRLLEMGPVLLGLSAMFLLGTGLALALAISIASGLLELRGRWLLVLGLPGFAFHAPGSLLLMPLAREAMKGYLYHRVQDAPRHGPPLASADSHPA